MSFEQIYIVHTEDPANEDSAANWYWGQDEAEREYDRLTSFEGYEVSIYSGNVGQAIQDYVDGAIDSGFSGLSELRSNRQAVDDMAWGELEYRPEGYFYIERTKTSTSEYWPYNVEPYNFIEAPAAWRLVDGTTDAPIAIIRHAESQFKVVMLDGHAQTEVFVNLKGAVIWAVEKYDA